MRFLLLCVVLLSTGCAMFRDREIDPDYQAYTETIKAQLIADRKPLVEIGIGEDSKISSIVINQPPRYVAIEQKNPHPIYGLCAVGLKYAGYASMIWVTGDAIAEIADSVQGTNINSFNNNSRNAGVIDLQGDYATTRTETLEAATTFEE